MDEIRNRLQANLLHDFDDPEASGARRSACNRSPRDLVENLDLKRAESPASLTAGQIILLADLVPRPHP